jgi:hypothetical protein
MPAAGLDDAELTRLAEALESLVREDIAAALPNFPDDWPIDAAGIEAVVDLAIQRCAPVAQRLRSLDLHPAT